MTKLSKEYKKHLLFYFFYITQIQCEDIFFKTKNSLKEEFSKYLEESEIIEDLDRGTIGKKTLKEFFTKYQDNSRLIIKEEGYYQITDIGVTYAEEEIAPKILEKHNTRIMEYLGLEYQNFLSRTLSTIHTVYPFPKVNEAYSYKNFYWYYRGAEFTRKYKLFYTRFLNDPWKKSFVRVSGPSNSGKSSFLKFLTEYNNRAGLSNKWIKKNKTLFKFKGVHIRYNNKITDLEKLHDWLAEERFRILKIPKHTKEEESQTSNVNDISQRSLLYTLNSDLAIRNKKLILIIDQGEVLLENLVQDKNKAHIFVTEFLSKFPKYENLALIFSISDEYIGVLEKILDKAESIDLHYGKFLIRPLSADLIETIIKNIRIIPLNTEGTGFKTVHIHDTEIELIKDSISDTETFAGTELIILLNELIKYGKYSGTQIVIPKLSAETYKNILNKWIQEKIEYRIAADPKISEHWEFLLLQELLKVSMNIAAPLPMNQVEIWYNNHIIYSGYRNPPSLEKMIRNLSKDGLINYNDQYISFKHQSVLESVKNRLSSEKLRLFRIRSLWESEIGLRAVPQQGPFKDAFENLYPFSEYIAEENSREKLALGLLEHHLEVDLHIPPQNFIEKILIQIFNIIDKPGFDFLSLLSLFKTLNNKGIGFFAHFQKDEERTSKLLVDKLIKLLETDFNPDVLIQLIIEINKSDSQISWDLCNEIAIYFKKEFPEICYPHIKFFLLLNNINEIHSHIISVLEDLPWDRFTEITLNDLGSLLENLRTVEEMTLARYKEGKEVQYLNSYDEQKLIEDSFVYSFFQKLIEHIQWEKIKWETLTIQEIHRLFDQFDRYLKFPDEIMLFDWNSDLQVRWQEEAEEILLLLMDKYAFTSRLLEKWPEKGKFPELSNFLVTQKLGLLNYFLSEVLGRSILGRNKPFILLNQEEFHIKNLEKLIKTSYYPALHDFKKILTKKCPTKLSDIEEIFENLKGNKIYLNRYHKVLSALSDNKSNIIIYNSEDFFSNSSSYKNDPSWYWPFLALPSILDLILTIEELKEEKEKEEMKNELIKSIEQKSEIWNNLFDHRFYIESFEDFYPGSEKNNYLRRKEHLDYGKTPSMEELGIFHHLGLSLLLYKLSSDRKLQKILEALIEHTDYLDYLFDQKYLSQITWKRSTRTSHEYGLQFITTRKNDDMYKLDNILTQARYNSPTESFFKLLESKNQVAQILLDRIKESNINDEISSPRDIISRNHEQFSFIIRQVMKGEDTKLSEWGRMWMEMFGLTRIDKPITSLGVGLETLRGLRDLSQKEDILEETPWDLHFSKMTREELKEIFTLFEENFFFRRNENTLIYSFMRGVLENFDRWYETLIGIYYERYSNRLIAITGLIGKFQLIGNEKQKQTFIRKLQEKLDLENWETTLEENRKEEDPLREVMEYLETTDHYLELIYHQQKIIEELFQKKNYLSCYFKTFWHVSIFTEWLQKKIEENRKGFSDYLTEFLNRTKELSFNLESTSYYGRMGGILIFIQSKALILPEMQELIVESDFFRQLREFLLIEVQENSYNFRYISNIFRKLKKMDQLGIIDRKVYIQEILEKIELEALLLTDDSRYRLRGFIEPNRENEEFIEILVNTKSFKHLNWTKIANKTDRLSWFDYYSFVDDLKNYSRKLVIGILSNPTFWDIKWIESINGWLINCDKRLANFIFFLERYRENKSVKTFIMSSDLMKCPWEHCYQKITQQEKENSSLLSKVEFEKIISFLSSINPDLHKLMINIGIKFEDDKKTKEK